MPGTWSDSPSGSCFKITVSVRLLSCKLWPWAWADWSRETVIQRLSGSSLNLLEAGESGSEHRQIKGKHSVESAKSHVPEGSTWTWLPPQRRVAATAHTFLPQLLHPCCCWLTDGYHPHPCSFVSSDPDSRLWTRPHNCSGLPPAAWRAGSEVWTCHLLWWDKLSVQPIRQGSSNHRKEFRCQTVPSYLLPCKDQIPSIHFSVLIQSQKYCFKKAGEALGFSLRSIPGRRGASWVLQYSDIEEGVFLSIWHWLSTWPPLISSVPGSRIVKGHIHPASECD